MDIYLKDLKINGFITKSNVSSSIDTSLMMHIFIHLPNISDNPHYNKFKILTDIENRIKIIKSFLRPVAIIYVTCIITLIILINLLGD
jgi:hypothetical protein